MRCLETNSYENEVNSFFFLEMKKKKESCTSVNLLCFICLVIVEFKLSLQAEREVIIIPPLLVLIHSDFRVADSAMTVEKVNYSFALLDGKGKKCWRKNDSWH